MTFKDRPGQVVKVSPTGLAVVPLAMLLRLIAPELDDVLVPTMHTEHTLRPAQVPNDFEALGIVDEVLDLHQRRAGRGLRVHEAFSQVIFPKRACGIPSALSSVRLPRPPPAPTWNPY